MWVPFVTKRSIRRLGRRKGGGGKSSKSGGSSGSRGGSGGAGSTDNPGRPSTPISTGGGSKGATPFSNGGGPISTIPSGSLFAGRSVGGGTRDEVYGTRTYGSGYPNHLGSRGVAGLGFPFFFWPLAWGEEETGAAEYLYDLEYGSFDNSSRPGGIMLTAKFGSSRKKTKFRLVADKSTVIDLISDIVSACVSSNLDNSSSIMATNYNNSLPSPKPEQAVQYYRASSVALTLDGYNNTGALGPPGTPDTPLPTEIDTVLLNCLNHTIGAAVPLVDASGSVSLTAPPTMGLVGLACLIWFISLLA